MTWLPEYSTHWIKCTSLITCHLLSSVLLSRKRRNESMILVHISLDDCDYSCCCPDSLSSLLKSYRQLQFNKIKDQGLSHEFSKWTWHHHLLFQQNVYIFFSWVIFLILWFISSRLWILRNHQLFWMTMTVFTWKYTSSCSHFFCSIKYRHEISTSLLFPSTEVNHHTWLSPGKGCHCFREAL